LVWDILEALSLIAIVAGGFLLFGPPALIVGGVLVLTLSWLVNRGVGGGEL
jgi:hypothetical protein